MGTKDRRALRRIAIYKSFAQNECEEKGKEDRREVWEVWEARGTRVCFLDLALLRAIEYRPGA